MAVNAIYQHHERTTTANLEADLQLREIGIDPVQKFLTAYSEVLGTKLHGITQESPASVLVGTISASNLSGTNTGDQTITLTGGVTGSGTGSFAATVITNANLTGPITSVGNATTIASQTGTGTTFAMSASPTFTGTVSGAALTLSSNLTLSLFTTGCVPYTTAGGLLTSGTGLTYNGSAFSVTGTGAFSGNVNIGGATDAAGYGLNASGLSLAASGGVGFYSFGVGTPASPTNAEFLQLRHNGTNGVLLVDKNGSGTYRSLLIQAGGSTAITVATNQAVTLSSTLGVTGATTLTGSATLLSTLDVKGATIFWAGNGASEYDISFKTSRGSVSSPTDVVNTDASLNLNVYCYSGGAYYATSSIQSIVDGTFTSGQRPPSRLEFYTNIANGAQTKQMSINGNGKITVASEINCGSASFLLKNTNVSAGDTILDTTSGDVIFKTSGAEIARISGSVGLTLAAGAGIKFSPGTDVLDTFTVSTFTVTIDGCTATTTATARYTRLDNFVTLYFPDFSGTDNSSGISTISGIPSALRPAQNTYVRCMVRDSGNATPGAIYWNGSTWTMYRFNGTAYTGPAVGQIKGFWASSMSYTLQ